MNSRNVAKDDLGFDPLERTLNVKKTFKYYFERETQTELVYRPVYYLQFFMMKKINGNHLSKKDGKAMNLT